MKNFQNGFFFATLAFFFIASVLSGNSTFQGFAGAIIIIVIIGLVLKYANRFIYEPLSGKLITRKNGWNLLLSIDVLLITCISIIGLVIVNHNAEFEEKMASYIVFGSFYIFALIKSIRSNLRERQRMLKDDKDAHI